jgi:hypothetical protein
MKEGLRVHIGMGTKQDKKEERKNMEYGTTAIYVMTRFISLQTRSPTDA